jgi:hypothetical protein
MPSPSGLAQRREKRRLGGYPKIKSSQGKARDDELSVLKPGRRDQVLLDDGGGHAVKNPGSINFAVGQS